MRALTRHVVAHICIDENGVYSFDAPTYEQGGTVGFGTQQVGDKPGNIDGTVEGLRATLKLFHDYFKDQVQRIK